MALTCPRSKVPHMRSTHTPVDQIIICFTHRAIIFELYLQITEHMYRAWQGGGGGRPRAAPHGKETPQRQQRSL